MKCIGCETDMAEYGYDSTYDGRCPDCLYAIVAKLPKCWGLRDGELVQDVVAVPGQTLWIPTPGGGVQELCVHRSYAVSEGLDRHDICLCCDSRAAAEKRGES